MKIDTIPQQNRPERPDIPRRQRISQYSLDEIFQLLQWVLSDNIPRGTEDIIKVMIPELGFRRSGSKIRAKIIDAIKMLDEAA